MKILKDIAAFALASALDTYFPRNKPTNANPSFEPEAFLPEDESLQATTINLEDFVKHLNSKIGNDSPHRIVDKMMEYGVTPQRFLITVTPENTAIFSFFMDCDPAFAVIIFTIGREYFGQGGLIGDSFLYRNDGTVCLSGYDDFPVIYIEYLQSILRRTRGAVTGSKRNAKLN